MSFPCFVGGMFMGISEGDTSICSPVFSMQLPWILGKSQWNILRGVQMPFPPQRVLGIAAASDPGLGWLDVGTLRSSFQKKVWVGIAKAFV